MLLRAILLSFAGVVRLNAIPCQLATSFFNRHRYIRSRVGMETTKKHSPRFDSIIGLVGVFF